MVQIFFKHNNKRKNSEKFLRIFHMETWQNEVSSQFVYSYFCKLNNFRIIFIYVFQYLIVFY